MSMIHDNFLDLADGIIVRDAAIMEAYVDGSRVVVVTRVTMYNFGFNSVDDANEYYAWIVNSVKTSEENEE